MPSQKWKQAVVYIWAEIGTNLSTRKKKIIKFLDISNFFSFSGYVQREIFDEEIWSA